MKTLTTHIAFKISDSKKSYESTFNCGIEI